MIITEFIRSSVAYFSTHFVGLTLSLIRRYHLIIVKTYQERRKAMNITKIGIVGSGHIGGNLGILLAKAGYEICFSSRHPETLENLIHIAGEKHASGPLRKPSHLEM